MVLLSCQVLELLGVGNAFTLLALIILSLQDIKSGEIHYRYLLLMVDFLYPLGYLLLLCVIMLYKFIDQLIGGADLLIFALLITRYGLYTTSLIAFYAAVIGLIYSVILKKGQIRFIPFILIGFLICLKGGL